MKTINSFRSKLFALALMASVSTFAYDFSDDGLFFNIIDNDNKLVEVTHQEKWYDENYSNLTHVTIPDTVLRGRVKYAVVSIGDRAFYCCSKLKTITLHGKIEYIDESAFSLTEISTFVLAMKNAEEACNNRVNKILYDIRQQYSTRKITINGEKVRDLVVPNTIDSISDYAFAYSYIASVDVPNNLKRINPTAFHKCPSLQSVYWNALDFEEVDSTTNAPFNKVASQIHTFKFGQDIKHIPAYLCYDMNRLDSIEIPAGVKSIGKHAFAHCSPSVVICHASQVPNIDESAFSKDYVSNTILYVPAESVEAYKNSEQWNKFTHIVAIGEEINDTDSDWDWWLEHDFAVDNFGYGIIENATTPSVQIIEAVGKSGHVDIPTEVIHNDTLYKVTGLGTGIVTTFRYSPDLTSVFIPKEILLVNNAVFADCPNLESIVVEEGNVHQDSRDNCNAVIRNLYADRSPELVIGCKNTTIPNGVLSIGSYAFRGCKGLQEIEVPSSVTTIYQSAFYDCVSLKSVVLGENITSINDFAFYNCYNLEKVVCLALTPPSKGASAFNRTPITDPDIEERVPIYVPDASVEVYKQAWKDYNIQPLSSMPVSENLFPTLWGLQRTSCTKTIGEDEYGTVWGARSYLMQEIETATIGGKQYLLFGTNNIYDEYCSLWLREESNKILVYSTAQKKDLVLYDFTLNVGDSLSRLYVDYELSSIVDYFKYEADWEYTKPLFVTEVSTITLLDGKEYKKWTFDNGIEYVEGIGSFGSNYGHNDFYQLIVNAPLYSDVHSQHLVCVSKNGKLLYMMDDAEMERLGAECLCDVETSYKDQWCNKWNVMWFDGWFFDETASTSQYRLGKDTIIGDYTYSKFNARTYVRFTEDRKVYVYYEGFDDNDPYTVDLPTGEYLAYDFSAQVGDTLEVFSGVHSYSKYKCLVREVQTDPETKLRTITLFQLLLEDTDGDGVEEEYGRGEMTWIEGVGSPNGFLINTPRPGGGLFTLLCAYKDDELKYTGDLYDEYGCEYNATEQSPEDLFPTLWGLQRTEVEYHTDGADAPSLVSFEEYTPTLVNGKWYLYDGMNYLREENNQVLLYSPHFEIYKDIVLYDWTLEVGDTLPYYFDKSAYKGAYYVVTNVSTITLLDGKEYKKWTLACGIEYIEGIGAINGEGYGHYLCLQHWDHPATYIGNRLVCASRNGQLLYQMDDTEMERLGAECLCAGYLSSYKSQWCDTWNVLDLKYRTIKYTTKEDFETWRYYLAQDTIINNYTYTAVTRQTTKVPEGVYPFTIPEPEYVAAVRFTDDRKVYIYYDNTEYLLYDFNVQPGDELTVFAGINHYHSHHTNTIRVAEVFGTEISLSVFPDFYGDVRPTCYGVTKWVEGVGDLCGFITGADCGLSEYQTALLCAYKDGNTEYTTEYEEYAEYGCEYNSGENKEYILTLPGLQRTVCNEYCGETEDDNSANNTYKQTFDKIFFENDKPYILYNDYLLREEDNKIFLYSQSLNKDIVLYDFTLEVGGSLPAYIKDFDGTMYSDDTLVVTDISSVTLLDGKEYKKWTFDNGMEYVEGIGMYGGRRNGNFFGLIREVVVPCHPGTHLVCVSKNGKLLYQMDEAEMERLGAECLCEYDRGPLKDNAKNGKIGGRPTPTQWNMLEVETKEMDGTSAVVRAETFSFTLENDSIVANGKMYYQLARQSTKDTAITKSVVGALHFSEDDGNRVYFLRDGVEYVLYDFTAEPGDTVEIFAGINNYPQETTYTHVVTGKDTLDNGACRMLLEVVFPDETATAENAEKVWLAGLGSVDGIVHNAAKRTSNAHAAPSRTAHSSDIQTSVMLCAWREDSCLYTTDHPDYDTLGCVYNIDEMTAIEDIHSPSSTTDYQKLLRNGQLLIIHKGKTYNVLGVAVE